MSVYGTSPIKRARRTKAEIEALDAALVEIVEQFRPVTVRQVFYQAVVLDLVPKDGPAILVAAQRDLNVMAAIR